MPILSGAQIIWESLAREGVKVVFGYPGGTILPAYDAMLNYPSIHHVLVRHEQGAAHAADGYAPGGARWRRHRDQWTRRDKPDDRHRDRDA